MADREAVNPRLLEILQHSLGVDRYGRGEFYRNHFVAGGQDEPLCEELVAMRFMRKHSRRGGDGDELTGGMPCYIVTDAGKGAMLRHSPKPPKSKRTQAFDSWERYCEAFNRIPFSQFLKEVWPNYHQLSR